MPRKKKSEFDKLLSKFVSECYHTDFKSQQVYSTECDDAQGVLGVMSACDGDMHLFMSNHPRMDNMGNPSFRSRTWFGGGRNERTRLALAILACAINHDKESEYEY